MADHLRGAKATCHYQDNGRLVIVALPGTVVELQQAFDECAAELVGTTDAPADCMPPGWNPNDCWVKIER